MDSVGLAPIGPVMLSLRPPGRVGAKGNMPGECTKSCKSSHELCTRKIDKCEKAGLTCTTVIGMGTIDSQQLTVFPHFTIRISHRLAISFVHRNMRTGPMRSSAAGQYPVTRTTGAIRLLVIVILSVCGCRHSYSTAQVIVSRQSHKADTSTCSTRVPISPSLSDNLLPARYRPTYDQISSSVSCSSLTMSLYLSRTGFPPGASCRVPKSSTDGPRVKFNVSWCSNLGTHPEILLRRVTSASAVM